MTAGAAGWPASARPSAKRSIRHVIGCPPRRRSSEPATAFAAAVSAREPRTGAADLVRPRRPAPGSCLPIRRLGLRHLVELDAVPLDGCSIPTSRLVVRGGAGDQFATMAGTL